MKPSAGLFMAALLCGPIGSSANVPPVATDAAAQHAAAAEAYFEAARYEEDIVLYVRRLVEEYAKVIAKQGGDPSPSMQSKLVRLVGPDFSPLVTQRRKEFLGLLIEYLSTDDLRQLASFIETPLGKRFTAAKYHLVLDNYDDTRALIARTISDVSRNRRSDFERLGLVFGGSKL